MKRRARPSAARLLARRALLLTALVLIGWPWLVDAWAFARSHHLPELFLSAATLLFVRRVHLSVQLWRRIRQLSFSDRAKHYVIERSDFRRGTVKESTYRRTMQLTLLAKFENKCAKCGANDDGVDLDHFFLPKAEGGCFIMRHADGYFVNNAIPLCVRCNRSKSNRSYRTFFAPEELPLLLAKNAELTKILNARALLDDEGRPHPRARSRVA